MVDLMHCLTNLLFFDIPLLCYYTNLNSSIICCLFSGDINLSFGFSISFFASATLLNAAHSEILSITSFKHLLFYLQFYYQLNH